MTREQVQGGPSTESGSGMVSDILNVCFAVLAI